jgi:FtsH-binding integral membrane protein
MAIEGGEDTDLDAFAGPPLAWLAVAAACTVVSVLLVLFELGGTPGSIAGIGLALAGLAALVVFKAGAIKASTRNEYAEPRWMNLAIIGVVVASIVALALNAWPIAKSINDHTQSCACSSARASVSPEAPR